MLLGPERPLRATLAAVFAGGCLGCVPFTAALGPPFSGLFLLVIVRSDLPIHAFRRLAYSFSLSRREPVGASCGPVFKPLFFQVKPLPCIAAAMVSAT